MTDEPIKPERLPSSEDIRGVGYALGCQDIETPFGLVHFHDAPGYTTTLIERPGIQTTIGLLVYDPEPGRGFIAQMNPEHARAVAGSLLRLADIIDGGGVKH